MDRFDYSLLLFFKTLICGSVQILQLKPATLLYTRMSHNRETLWQILSIGMIVPGTAAFLYALAAVTLSNDPLAVIFIPLVLMPSLPPAILGWFMWKGKEWALVILRIVIVGILLGGIFLNIA